MPYDVAVTLRHVDRKASAELTRATVGRDLALVVGSRLLPLPRVAHPRGRDNPRRTVPVRLAGTARAGNELFRARSAAGPAHQARRVWVSGEGGGQLCGGGPVGWIGREAGQDGLLELGERPGCRVEVGPRTAAMSLSCPARPAAGSV